MADNYQVDEAAGANPEVIPMRTESYFRRTPFLVSIIVLEIIYIISCSIGLGIVVADGQHNGMFSSLGLPITIFLFFSLIMLASQIRALYEKNSLERGSILLASYIWFGGIFMWQFPTRSELNDSNEYLRVLYIVSIVFIVLKFAFALFYIIVLVSCSKGIPEHNKTIKDNCNCCRI